MVSVKTLAALSLCLITALPASARPMGDTDQSESDSDLDPKKNPIHGGKMCWSPFEGPNACNRTLTASDVKTGFFASVKESIWHDGKNCGKNVTAWFVNGKNRTAEIIGEDFDVGCGITGSPAVFEIGNPIEKGRESAWWQLQD